MHRFVFHNWLNAILTLRYIACVSRSNELCTTTSLNGVATNKPPPLRRFFCAYDSVLLVPILSGRPSQSKHSPPASPSADKATTRFCQIKGYSGGWQPRLPSISFTATGRHTDSLSRCASWLPTGSRANNAVKPLDGLQQVDQAHFTGTRKNPLSYSSLIAHDRSSSLLQLDA